MCNHNYLSLFLIFSLYPLGDISLHHSTSLASFSSLLLTVPLLEIIGTAKAYSLEYADIRKVLFTPHHLGCWCSNMIRVHYCILAHSCINFIQGHCCVLDHSSSNSFKTLAQQCLSTMIWIVFALSWHEPLLCNFPNNGKPLVELLFNNEFHPLVPWLPLLPNNESRIMRIDTTSP
jgi:hypothetical protein